MGSQIRRRESSYGHKLMSNFGLSLLTIKLLHFAETSPLMITILVQAKGDYEIGLQDVLHFVVEFVLVAAQLHFVGFTCHV